MTDLVPLLVGAGGFIAAAVALYRARSDKTSVEVKTDATLMEAAVATAKGLAEASAMVVQPLREELASARERLAKVELHAKNCDEKLDTLGKSFAALEARVLQANGTTQELLAVGIEARAAVAEAHEEVAAQQKERERVQERDRKADEAR